MPGATATEFDPSGPVPRKDMAIFLANFLSHAPDAVVTLLDEGTERGTYVLGDAEEPPNDQFCDAHRTTPRHVDSAISVIYELGVTVGQADATTGPCAGERIFGPEGSVTRGQMAAFITRALGHTNARPAGLTAQNTSDGVVVSVRDSEHAPVVNLPVDAFYYSTEDVSRAFNVDDECTRRVLPVEAGTFSTCEIGPDDPVTQTDGNAVLSPIPTADIGEDGVTVVVWTGRDEETFEDGITLFYQLTITEDEAELPPPSSASVTSDREEETNSARYGSRVTFTIQLQGVIPGSMETVDVPREKGEDGEISYTLALATYRNPTDVDALDAEANEGTLWRRTTEEVVIARDGSATFSVTASDPDTMAASADTSYVQWTLTPGDNDPAPEMDERTGIVVFSDASGTATNVEITAEEFVLASADSRRAASNTVTVTVTDQYGNPVRGAAVTLASDQDGGDADIGDSDVPTRARSTSRSGQVRITYRYTGDAGVETLRASLTDGYRAADDDEPAIGTEGIAEIGSPCHAEDVCGDKEIYWAAIWESDLFGETSDGDFAILNADLDDNEIVADSGDGTVEPVVVYYDSTDYYDVTLDMDAAGDSGPVSMAAFEEALGAAIEAYEEAVAEADQADTVPRPTISWTSYESDDDADIARFSLDATTS